MSRVFSILMVVVCIFGLEAKCAERPDSVSAAYATVWGDYIKSQLERNFQGDSASVARFMSGFEAAMSLEASEEPYYQGVIGGFEVAKRIKQMQQMQIPVNEAGFVAALNDIIAGKSTGFTREKAEAYLQSYMHRNEKRDTVGMASQEAFLAKQRERKSVEVTPSGLHFETLKAGTGETPQSTDKVRVTYVGRLADGTVFDSTDEPIEFDVNRLVKGFTEGLQLMREGGRYRMFIPASLGYGDRGVDGVIPGNAVLDFEVELIGIVRE